MIPTSSAYKEAILQNRHFDYKASVVLMDGTTLMLSASDFLSPGFKISDGVSNSNSFEVGCAAIGMFEASLNNFSAKFDPVDFTGAVFNPCVGLRLPGGTTEWIPKGVFTTDKAEETEGTIKITAYDNMARFDKPYSKSTIVYPATLGEILRDCCSLCGVTLKTLRFLNDGYVVATRPVDGKTNFREIVSAIAQLAGCFARIDNTGSLALGWYDLDLFGGADIIGPASIKRLQSSTISTENVQLTGVQIVPDQEDAPIYLSGQAGYVVSIEKNPLVQGEEEILASSLGAKLIGFSFRPMQLSALSDPSIEAGDVALVTDRKGTTYQTIISNLTFSAGNWESYSADAETLEERQSTRYSEASKVVQVAKKVADQKITDYDLQVQQLSSLLANAMGTYQTVEKLEDGSTICYAHDKPELEKSMKIWKKTAGAFAVSDDGGKTWHGMTADGNIIAKVLSVIGINADWMRVGKISSPVNPYVYFDLANGFLAANRLVGATEGATDVYAAIGLVDWPDGGKSKGLDLWTQRGLFLRLHQQGGFDGSPNESAGIVSYGDIDIRSNSKPGASPEDASRIAMSKGIIQFATGEYARASIESDGSYFSDLYQNGLKVFAGIEELWSGSIDFNGAGLVWNGEIFNQYRIIIIVGTANRWGNYPQSAILPTGTWPYSWHLEEAYINILHLYDGTNLTFTLTPTTITAVGGFDESHKIVGILGVR